MQIGVEKLAFTQLRPFRWLRFLDLDDHVRAFEDFLGAAYDLGAGSLVGRVISVNAHARLGLDDHFMTMRHIFTHRAWRQADTVFMVLDFLGATYAH